MALIGSIEALDPESCDVAAYLERIDQLFNYNNVENDKKISLFLTLIGGEAYGVLKDLYSPALPSTKTFIELRKKISDHYSPKRLVIAGRYLFYSATQEPEENVKSYAIRPKNLSKYCQFGDFLDQALRDRFVCGVRSEVIKGELLAEDKLTFDKAFTTVTGMEVAGGQVRIMESGYMVVHKLSHNFKFGTGPNKFNGNKPSNRNGTFVQPQ